MVRTEWTTVEFPLNFQRKTPVDELTLTFSNDQVGALKKGAVHLKNFKIDPKPVVPEEAAAPTTPKVKGVTITPKPAAVKAPVPPPAASDSLTL